MKIRTDFITNSSSSAFVVLKDSNYYKMLQKQADFHFKSGYDLSRCTGVYVDGDIMKLIWGEYNDWILAPISELITEHGLKNLAIVMVSDEEMGGILPSPDQKDILFETEYH